jgi:hypothetical protein
MSKQTDLINIPDAITVSGSNVGIGTSSLSTKLTVLANSANGIDLAQDPDNGTNSGRLFFTTSGGSNSIRSTSGALQFSTGATAGSSSGIERMRLDTSGNFLVGQTTASSGTVGTSIRSDGRNFFCADGGYSAQFNRKSSDGAIVNFAKNDTVIGALTARSGDLAIHSTTTNHVGLVFGATRIEPANNYGTTSNNTVDLGNTDRKFQDIYATNGTIQTSDQIEKQDIASLTATEMLVGKRISALFKTFRWKDSVADKGDNARTHTGIIAQDVQAAFTAEGLDAGDYALFISSTWWEHDVDVPAVEAVEAVDEVKEATTDEDGNEVVIVITEAVVAVEARDAYTRTDNYHIENEAPEGSTEVTRMGIRYPELLSFVAAYNEQRFASIEARLTALEA